jgi:hypothetical protein
MSIAEIFHKNLKSFQNKIVYLQIFILSVVIYGCNNQNNKMVLHNQNGISGNIEIIIECFVKEHNIKGKIILVSDDYYIPENILPASVKDLSKYVNVHLMTFDKTPNVNEGWVLYSTKLNDYTLFYIYPEDKKMGISNNLVWHRIEQPIKEKHSNFSSLRIIDYVETELIYNKEENVIELSDFKSASCKGRLTIVNKK